MKVERRYTTDDVSRASLLAQGFAVAIVGVIVSLLALHGSWAIAGALGATIIGSLIAVLGQTSSFWIEGDSVFWGNSRTSIAVNIAEADEIRTVFVLKGPRNLRISRAAVSVEIPIELSTEPLRREIGRIFRERWPTRTLTDPSAMRSMFL